MKTEITTNQLFDAMAEMFEQQNEMLSGQFSSVHDEMKELDGRMHSLETSNAKILRRIDTIEGLQIAQYNDIKELFIAMGQFEKKLKKVNDPETKANFELLYDWAKETSRLTGVPLPKRA